MLRAAESSRPGALSWAEAVLSLAGFVALSFLFCFPAGWSGELPCTWGDGAAYYVPVLIRAFQPPSPDLAGAWDATAYTGLPTSHFPAGIYYPPTALFYSCLPVGWAYSLGQVLHFAFAGTGAYWLARLWRRSVPAAALAGVTFAFGGFLVFHRHHVNVHQTCAWIPWVLAAMEMFRRKGALFWVAAAGTAMTLHALASYLQMVIFAGIFWLTYLGYFLVVGPGPTLSRPRFTAGVLTACLLGAVGSLPVVLPLTEVAGWSAYAKPSLEFFAGGNIRLRHLAGFFGPYLLGQLGGIPPLAAEGYLGLTEHGFYSGALPLLAAMVGVAAWWRCRQGSTDDSGPPVGFWVVAGGLNLVLMLDRVLGHHYLLFHVPVYNLFHLHPRHVCFVGLALGQLAAFGVDHLGRDVEYRRPLRSAVLLYGVLLAGALALVITESRWPIKPHWTYAGFWMPVVCAVAAAAVLSAAARFGPAGRTWVLAVVPLAAFADLRWQIGAYEYVPGAANVLVDPDHAPEAIRWLRQHAGQQHPPRALIGTLPWPWDADRLDIPHALPSAWGIASLNGYNQGMPASLVALLRLNSYGMADTFDVLAEERGLSAVAGRYVVHTGPLLVSHQRGAVVDRVSRPGRYLVEATRRTAAPQKGFLRIHEERVGRRVLLDEVPFGADDWRDGRHHVYAAFDHKMGFPISVTWHECDGRVVGAATFRVWKLTDAFAAQTRSLPAAAVAQLLNADADTAYPVLARLEREVTVRENPRARDLATLVRRVRPAASEAEAVRLIRDPGPPVRELACVVGAATEAEYSPGEVELVRHAAGRIDLRTRTSGQGFLVLAVTRCRGWTACVDGQEVAIAAVDGPLMGVEVPAGEHEVVFRYRPVLLRAGAVAAGLALGGVWVVVLLRRRRRSDGQIALPAPTLAQLRGAA